MYPASSTADAKMQRQEVVSILKDFAWMKANSVFHPQEDTPLEHGPSLFKREVERCLGLFLLSGAVYT